MFLQIFTTFYIGGGSRISNTKKTKLTKLLVLAIYATLLCYANLSKFITFCMSFACVSIEYVIILMM